MRAITIGLPIWTSSATELSEDVINLDKLSKKLMSQSSMSARTTRLTLPPMPVDMMLQPSALVSTMSLVQDIASKAGSRWYCLPINLMHEIDYEPILNELLSYIIKDQKLFVNLIVADESKISLRGAQIAAKFIINLSRRSFNGFDNFRVGVSSACVANTPFFPFSRHDGERLCFSLALETTLGCIDAIESLSVINPAIDEMQIAIKDALLKNIEQANQFGVALEQISLVEYRGLDASYAPFPDGKSSVGSLIEKLGVSPVGASGTLFATSILTDALKAALLESKARCSGFNGVMYSVLEDNTLASSNNLTALSIEKLALFSTLCGCGIDMVPIAGSVYEESITSIILDISALAVRLKKPLGVRVVPIPNKIINEYATFNLDFLCDSRVMNTGVIDKAINTVNFNHWVYLN